MTTSPTTDDPTRLIIRRYFNAPRDAVFRALVEPALLSRWMGPGLDWTVPEISVDAQVGGRYRLVMRSPEGSEHPVGGEFLVIDPPDRLVYSWAWENNPASVTRVTYDLRDGDDGGTRLTLTHDRFSEVTVRDRHGIGWNGCLDRLEAAATS